MIDERREWADVTFVGPDGEAELQRRELRDHLHVRHPGAVERCRPGGKQVHQRVTEPVSNHRRPESRVAGTLRLAPIFAGPEIARRPAAMHDLPFAPCRLEPAGLTVLRAGDGSEPTELVVIMRAKRAAMSCELWLNSGDRIGEVVRDKRSLGLLDFDGHLVVESDQRFGLQFFDSASTFRLASGRRDTLSLEGGELVSRVVRNGCVLETGGGHVVARAVQTSRSRRERIVVTSIKTTLSPIDRAIVVLRVCTLLDLPKRPAVSP